MKILQTLVVASLLTITASASAALQSFEINPNTGGSFSSDQIDGISTTFNDESQRFTWNTSLAAGSEVDGFWLVVNNGPNPKASNTNELAIIYGDLETGILSTYVYNGASGNESIVNPGILLQTDTMNVTDGGFSFDISTGSINSWSTAETAAEYTGIAFGESIGIWFHFFSDSIFNYGADGEITDFAYNGTKGWYDVANLTTTTTITPVSAPSAIALFGLAFAGLTLVRRKSN